jgi:hypothetical protein
MDTKQKMEEERINSFRSVATATHEQARAHLELASWDLSV